MSEKRKNGFSTSDHHAFLAAKLLMEAKRVRSPRSAPTAPDRPKNIRDSSLTRRAGQLLTEISASSPESQTPLMGSDLPDETPLAKLDSL